MTESMSKGDHTPGHFQERVETEVKLINRVDGYFAGFLAVCRDFKLSIGGTVGRPSPWVIGKRRGNRVRYYNIETGAWDGWMESLESRLRREQ